MGRDNRTSLLTIGQVVDELRRTHPDVTHSSLRFLERQGLLEAARTSGGHRLYARSDVDRIRQIKAWQTERLSLHEIRERLAQRDRLPVPADLADLFLRQALAGDLAAAQRTVLEADAVGLPLAALFGEVLQPALTEVGERWARGELLVAQEKEVSEVARELIAELSLRHARPHPGGPAVVAACVEGERHDLGLRMVCGLLRAAGCSVHVLGADVAPRFLVEAARLHSPAAVLLSAKLEPNLRAVKDAVDALDAGLAPDRPPPTVVGGRVAIEHAEAVRAWGAVPVAAASLPAAVDVALALIAMTPSGRSATDEEEIGARFPT